ncbi:MAG: GPW/gp25 family protein [candidate division Zixibacteria bacterium]|nr:GPW/gp25 family protein [candidate division Zixibacteria bacterium]
MEYISLPFVLREGYLTRANLEDSITYSVGLLLSTRAGMIPFNPDFGCDIWEKEYSDLYTANKSDVRASLRNAIDKFEKRLYNVSVSFVPVSDNAPHILGMAVKVSGNYRNENSEEQKYEGTFYLG